MAAGVRLIRSWTGNVCAGIACALCLAAYPFVGTFVGIPAVVAVLCVGYVLWRSRHEKRKSGADAPEVV